MMNLHFDHIAASVFMAKIGLLGRLSLGHTSHGF